MDDLKIFAGPDIAAERPLSSAKTLMTWLPEFSAGRRRELLDAIVTAAAEHQPYGFVLSGPKTHYELELDPREVIALCHSVVDHNDAGVRRTFAHSLARKDWSEGMPLLGYLAGDSEPSVRRSAYSGIKKRNLQLFQALKTVEARAVVAAEPTAALPEFPWDRFLGVDAGFGFEPSVVNSISSVDVSSPPGATVEPPNTPLPFTLIRRRTELGYSSDSETSNSGQITLRLRVEGTEDIFRSLDIRVPEGKDHATLLVHSSSQSPSLRVEPEIQQISVPRNADSDEARLEVTALNETRGNGEVTITIFDEYRLVGSAAVTLRAELRDRTLVLEKIRDVLFRDAGESAATPYVGPTIQLSLTNEATPRVQFHMPVLGDKGKLELTPLGFSRDGYDALSVLSALASLSTRIDTIEQNLGNPQAVGVQTTDEVLKVLAIDFNGIAREIVDNLISVQTRTVLARLDAHSVVQWVIKNPRLDAVPWELAFQTAAQSTLKEPILLVRVPVRDDVEVVGSSATAGVTMAPVLTGTTKKLAYIVGDDVALPGPPLNGVLKVVDAAKDKGFNVVPNVSNGARQQTQLLKLIQDFSDADIVHILCHGVIESSGNLYLKVEKNLAGQLLPHHIRAFKLLKRPLVFINACSSAAATFGALGFTSFARSFLAAGASAYIGTLAPVVTPTALRFATEFFDALLGKGLSVAGAMNAARQAMADDPDPTWRLYAIYGDLAVASVPGS